MAFAPHTNDRRTIGEDPIVLGQFREADHGHTFEYADRATGGEDYLIPDPQWGVKEFPHLLYVGPNGQTRYARVLKTVAYVVVDEGDRGVPVTEKWSLRGHKEYDVADFLPA